MSEANWAAHRARVESLAGALTDSEGPVRLRKRTSNLFRPREAVDRTELDVTSLNQVIGIDAEAGVAEVEGMTPYVDLVDATLPHGFAPAIVPELKSITVGGAMTGLGIESSAFRYGLVHHTVREMDVLVADGRVLTCSPEQHPELFFGFPNSYGSLGYTTRLRVDLIPVTPYVRLEHTSFSDAEQLFAAIARECEQPTCAYLDGVYFAPGEFVLTRAHFIDALPAGVEASDYTWLQQYWKSLHERQEDYLSIHDYLWRWDTDWFWCSKNLGMQFKPLRFVMGRKRLNSITYQKIMRASHHWPLSMLQYFRPRTESVIQDVDIPIDNAAAFLAEFENQIGIRPVWICPFVVPDGRFSLFELRTDTPYINFGFWDMVRSSEPDGHYNALVEELVARHGGKKSLYSRSTYDESRFWQEYDRETYESLKRECDPDGRFPGLYEKAVGQR
ncbi:MULTISPECIES: FAD-binding oxidoreductase [unclassified Wenzhouxiangella]|uniref:FAD-binding oxidoreductase n=1 Tax=unclassified Wenzhouxiangella TaxID=2613841 RepID=UPI000E32CA38|nr:MULTISPECIES: FAD-binding oxidoreductase [unclassified Wenzhouxiangella]RFF29001.1 FAD-binding oxidoreductase [Wenzhouxiangella sp. 15181]RFP68293.1 FAD-binding oxidoreductase [Wenzhouxiangella sp. 15190]